MSGSLDIFFLSNKRCQLKKKQNQNDKIRPIMQNLNKVFGTIGLSNLLLYRNEAKSQNQEIL